MHFSRIARIFNQRKGGVPRARYTSPSSQLTIAALLASIEIVVNVCWLIAAPPTVVFIYPVRYLFCFYFWVWDFRVNGALYFSLETGFLEKIFQINVCSLLLTQSFS